MIHPPWDAHEQSWWDYWREREAEGFAPRWPGDQMSRSLLLGLLAKYARRVHQRVLEADE